MNIYQSPSFARLHNLSNVPVLEKSTRPPYTVCVTQREYGSVKGATYLVLITDRSAHKDLEQTAIVCYSLEEVERYCRAPVVVDQGKSYRLDGFKGMLKFELHLAWKGACFLPRARQVDWHKMDMRDIRARDAYQVKSKIKSCLDHKASLPYLGKKELYKLGDFVPRLWTLKDFVFEQGKVYIAKPIGLASSGQGISVFNTIDGLEQAKKIIYAKWKEGLVCEYIGNPLLYREKKFHLRVYLFVSTTGHWSVLPEAKMITAKLPYLDDDYSNRDIHDTHLDKTDANLFFSRDFSGKKEKVWPQVENICAQVAVLPFVGYEEAEISYDILGLDILVDDKNICWLLEVNFTPSLDPVTYKDYGQFAAQYINWEVENVNKCLG